MSKKLTILYSKLLPCLLHLLLCLHSPWQKLQFVAQGQTCTRDAVFPRIFGVTEATSPDLSLRDMTDSHVYYAENIQTLLVASKSNYDPSLGSYGDFSGFQTDTPTNFNIATDTYTMLSIYPTESSKDHRRPAHQIVYLNESSFPLSITCLNRDQSPTLTSAQLIKIVQTMTINYDNVNSQAICALTIQVDKAPEYHIVTLTLLIDMGNPETALSSQTVNLVAKATYGGVSNQKNNFAVTSLTVHQLDANTQKMVMLNIFNMLDDSPGGTWNSSVQLHLLNNNQSGPKAQTMSSSATEAILPLSRSSSFFACQQIDLGSSQTRQVLVLYDYDLASGLAVTTVKKLLLKADTSRKFKVTAITEMNSETMGEAGVTSASNFYIGIANSALDTGTSYVTFVDFVGKTQTKVSFSQTSGVGGGWTYKIVGLQCDKQNKFKCSVLCELNSVRKEFFFVQFKDTVPGTGTFMHIASKTLTKESDNSLMKLFGVVPHKIDTNPASASYQHYSFIYVYNTMKQEYWRTRNSAFPGNSDGSTTFRNNGGGLIISANSAENVECDRFLGWIDQDTSYWQLTVTPSASVNEFTTNPDKFFTLLDPVNNGFPEVDQYVDTWRFLGTMSDPKKLEMPIFKCKNDAETLGMEGVAAGQTFNCFLSSQTGNGADSSLERSCSSLQLKVPQINVQNDGLGICREQFFYFMPFLFYKDQTDLMFDFSDPSMLENDCAKMSLNDNLKCRAYEINYMMQMTVLNGGQTPLFYPIDGTSAGTLNFGDNLDQEKYKGVEMMMYFAGASERGMAQLPAFKFTIGYEPPIAADLEVELEAPAFTVPPTPIYQLGTPEMRFVDLGTLTGGDSDTVTVSITVNEIAYEQSAVVDYDTSQFVLTLNSKREFFTNTFKDKIQEAQIGAIITETIELDLKFTLTHTTSQKTTTYESKVQLVQWQTLPAAQLDSQLSQQQSTAADSSNDSQSSTSSSTTAGGQTENTSNAAQAAGTLTDETQSSLGQSSSISTNTTQSDQEQDSAKLDMNAQIEMVNQMASKISREIGLPPVQTVIVEQMQPEEEPPAKTAVFDLQQWTETSELTNEIARNEIVTVQKKDSFNLKQSKLLLNLQQTYSVPKVKRVTQRGVLGVQMSNQIKVKTYNQLYQMIKKQNRKLASSSDVSNETNQAKIVESSLSLSEINKIDALFKAAGLIVVKLIPGSASLIEEARKFDWKLESYTEAGIKIQVKFKNPELISIGEFPDKLEILFKQTQLYLEPEDSSMTSVPDGFQIIKVLPPQRNPEQAFVMEETNVKGNMQGFVITQFLLAFVLNFSLQTIFQAILSFQILAYLPLLNVPIPGEAYLFFETLAAIVEFDILPVFDIWDAGFTQTEPLTPGFQMLKFESLNFVESMGGVLIIGVLMLFYPLIALLLLATGLIYKLKSSRQNFESLRIKQALMGFMHGAAFDILISASLALYSFELLEVFNVKDYASTIFMVLFVVFLVIFLLIISKFSFITTGKISILEQAKMFEQFEDLVDNIHTQFASQKSVNLKVVEKKQKEKDLLLEKANKIDEIDFDVYLPLIIGLHIRKKSALIFPIMFILRRFVILAIIFLLRDSPGFQVISFMLISLLNLAYLCHAMPHVYREDNFREILQEFCLLECACLYMMLVTLPESSLAVGQIAYLIVIMASIATIPVLIKLVVDTVKFVILTLKKKYRMWQYKRMMALKAKSAYFKDLKKPGFSSQTVIGQEGIESFDANFESDEDQKPTGKEKQLIKQQSNGGDLTRTSRKVIKHKLSYKKSEIFSSHVVSTTRYMEPIDNIFQQSAMKDLIQPEKPVIEDFGFSSQSSLKDVSEVEEIVDHEKYIDFSSSSLDNEKESKEKKYRSENPDPEQIIVNINTLERKHTK